MPNTNHAAPILKLMPKTYRNGDVVEVGDIVRVAPIVEGARARVAKVRLVGAGRVNVWYIDAVRKTEAPEWVPVDRLTLVGEEA